MRNSECGFEIRSPNSALNSRRVIPGGVEPPISSAGERRSPTGSYPRSEGHTGPGGPRVLSRSLTRRRGRIRTLMPLRGARVSTAARPAVSGSRPFREPRGVEPRRRACKAQLSPASDPSSGDRGTGQRQRIVRLSLVSCLLSPAVTEVGVEPTLHRLSTCRLCRLAYPVISARRARRPRPVADPGVEPGLQAYETRTGRPVCKAFAVTVGFEPTLSTF